MGTGRHAEKSVDPVSGEALATAKAGMVPALWPEHVATRAIRGARSVGRRAERALNEAVSAQGPEQPVAFPNTAYYLPTIFGYTGVRVEKLGDMVRVLERARRMLPPRPTERAGRLDLGEILNAGMATLLAEEIIEGVRFASQEQPAVLSANDRFAELSLPPSESLRLPRTVSQRSTEATASSNGDGWPVLNGPIDDVHLRTWGGQLADGRIPGLAVIVGCAKSNEVAVKIVRELQHRGILVFLSGSVKGRSAIHQLIEEGVQLGYGTCTVAFGTDTISTVHALGFATRLALAFGGMEGGQAEEMLLYSRRRVFAFVLALGEVDDVMLATAAGSIGYGFPCIADTAIAQVLPNAPTPGEPVFAAPFDEIPGANDLERAEWLVQRCAEVRGIATRITRVPIPVAYGSAFGGEPVRRAAMHVELGGRGGRCFEVLRSKPLDEVEDGKIVVVGPDLDEIEEGGGSPLGIVVEVAGRRMRSNFEPVLERQIHHLIDGAEGVQHLGQRDATRIRVGRPALRRGFRVRHFGDIIHARLHADFGAIVDKVQVTLCTERDRVRELGEAARVVYRDRDARAAGLTDESVDVFYSCTLCQSVAPNHVCVISPERVGLCGAYNWLDGEASFEINPAGPNQPIAKQGLIDAAKGEWESLNAFVYQQSNQSVERVTLYSVMDAPTTAGGFFECVMMVIPEANGVMVVSREDPSVTPAGVTFSTLAGMAAGGQQSPGLMGLGKLNLLSKKLILAEGGLRRVVWMSSLLKESMADELRRRCEELGEPDLVAKIADERVAKTVEDLMARLEMTGHPALSMDPLM